MGRKKRVPRVMAAHSVGVRWITLIYFCSGICSLIDEVVWVRLLKLTLGNTVYASSIVISMFMGGLALGALLMTRFADRVERPLRLYALLEVCATFSALSLPIALRFADQGYRWFYTQAHPSPAGLLALQVIVSAVLLLVPAMVMGSTLPLLSRYVTAVHDRVGRLVGRLYALNMLGATLGTFLAGFVLIRSVGVMGTLYIAAGINLLVAVSGWVLARSQASVPTAPADAGGGGESWSLARRRKNASGFSSWQPSLLVALSASAMSLSGCGVLSFRSAGTPMFSAPF